VEKQLAIMWGEALRIDPPGIYDNFFDLGGQSLTAMKLIAMINKTFAVKVALITFFQLGTIKGLAGLIIEKQHASLSISAPGLTTGKPNRKKPRTFAEVKFEKKKRRKIKV